MFLLEEMWIGALTAQSDGWKVPGTGPARRAGRPRAQPMARRRTDPPASARLGVISKRVAARASARRAARRAARRRRRPRVRCAEPPVAQTHSACELLPSCCNSRQLMRAAAHSSCELLPSCCTSRRRMRSAPLLLHRAAPLLLHLRTADASCSPPAAPQDSSCELLPSCCTSSVRSDAPSR